MQSRVVLGAAPSNRGLGEQRLQIGVHHLSTPKGPKTVIKLGESSFFPGSSGGKEIIGLLESYETD